MLRFTVNDDNTVTDSQTGLTWSRQTIARGANFDQAEKAVADLGEGWRLPTVHELFSLADHTREEPAISTTIFPDTDSNWYWTNTATAWDEAARWVVGFSLGNVSHGHRDYDACVRAVRAGQ